MPPVIVSNASNSTHQQALGSLFDGLKFFLVQKVPMRSRWIADIEANGGTVVRLEKQADYVIADHMKKDAPNDSYSWTLIDTALNTGEMPDPERHRAGPRPGTVREVGSGIPAKGTRTRFTLEDDRELWQFVQREQARGGKVKGNDIYKRLEQHNPRHSLQAWRDRYITKVMGHPPSGVDVIDPASLPPSPPSAQDEQHVPNGMDGTDDICTPPAKRRRVEDSPKLALGEIHQTEGPSQIQDDIDTERLLKEAQDIEALGPEVRDEAWIAWSEGFPHRSAGEWVQFWLEQVRPIHLKQGADWKLQEKSEEAMREPQPRNRRRPSRRSVHNNQLGSAEHQSHLIAPQSVDSDVGDDDPAKLTLAEASARSIHRRSMPSDIEVDTSGTRSFDIAALGKVQFSDLPTSDANQEANKQILDDMSLFGQQQRNNQDSSGEDDDVYESTITTPQKRAKATSPVQNETVQRRRSQSPLAERARMSQSGWLVSDDDCQHDVESQYKDGTALTEANLAKQEAQYKPSVHRGIDLAEDDPAKDQTDWVKYLKSAVHGRQSLAVSAEQPATSSDMSASVEYRADATAEIIAHVSQDDIDETVRQNTKGPSSPQQISQRTTAALPKETHAEQSSSTWSAGLHTQHADHTFPQPGSTDSQNGASDFEHAANDDGGDDLSNHDVDLTVAIPDNEIGFGPSSDRNSQLFMSEGTTEAQPYANSNRYNQFQPAADVIEISCASPSSSPLDSSERGEDAPDAVGRAPTARVLETQDIYGAETQQPDLTMPLPPEFEEDGLNDDEQYADDDDRYGDENEDELDKDDSLQPIRGIERQTSRRPRKHSPNPSLEINSQEEAVLLESWMATMKVRGHIETVIIQALKCTSMSLELAELVLMHIKGGKGIPDDVPGVWSHEEDEQMEGGNARALRRLEAKHGWPACAARLQFLEDYRDGD